MMKSTPASSNGDNEGAPKLTSSTLTGSGTDCTGDANQFTEGGSYGESSQHSNNSSMSGSSTERSSHRGSAVGISAMIGADKAPRGGPGTVSDLRDQEPDVEHTHSTESGSLTASLTASLEQSDLTLEQLEQLGQHTPELPLLRPASVLTTSINISKNLVGSGLLCLPWSLYEGSYFLSIPLMIILGILNALTFWTMGVLGGAECSSLGSLWEKILGKKTAWLSDVVLLVNGTLTGMSYMVILGTYVPNGLPSVFGSIFGVTNSSSNSDSESFDGNAATTSDSDSSWRDQVTTPFSLVKLTAIAPCMVILIALCLIRNLKTLQWPSMLGLAFQGYCIVFVVYDWAANGFIGSGLPNGSPNHNASAVNGDYNHNHNHNIADANIASHSKLESGGSGELHLGTSGSSSGGTQSYSRNGNGNASSSDENSSVTPMINLKNFGHDPALRSGFLSGFHSLASKMFSQISPEEGETFSADDDSDRANGDSRFDHSNDNDSNEYTESAWSDSDTTFRITSIFTVLSIYGQAFSCHCNSPRYYRELQLGGASEAEGRAWLGKYYGGDNNSACVMDGASITNSLISDNSDDRDSGVDQYSQNSVVTGSVLTSSITTTASSCIPNLKSHFRSGPYRYFLVTAIAFTFAISVSCLFAIAGFGRFGAMVDANVLDTYAELPEDRTSTRVAIAWLGTAFSIISSFPLVFNPPRQAFFRLFRVTWKSGEIKSRADREREEVVKSGNASRSDLNATGNGNANADYGSEHTESGSGHTNSDQTTNPNHIIKPPPIPAEEQPFLPFFLLTASIIFIQAIVGWSGVSLADVNEFRGALTTVPMVIGIPGVMLWRIGKDREKEGEGGEGCDHDGRRGRERFERRGNSNTNRAEEEGEERSSVRGNGLGANSGGANSGGALAAGGEIEIIQSRGRNYASRTDRARRNDNHNDNHDPPPALETGLISSVSSSEIDSNLSQIEDDNGNNSQGGNDHNFQVPPPTCGFILSRPKRTKWIGIWWCIVTAMITVCALTVFLAPGWALRNNEEFHRNFTRIS